jgi:hypothetical protein
VIEAATFLLEATFFKKFSGMPGSGMVLGAPSSAGRVKKGGGRLG